MGRGGAHIIKSTRTQTTASKNTEEVLGKSQRSTNVQLPELLRNLTQAAADAQAPTYVSDFWRLLLTFVLFPSLHKEGSTGHSHSVRHRIMEPHSQNRESFTKPSPYSKMYPVHQKMNASPVLMGLRFSDLFVSKCCYQKRR